MESKFSIEEKRSYKLKKHIKEHLLDYIGDMVVTVLYTLGILYLAKAENFTYGIILAIMISLVRIIAEVRRYKKDYINIDIKD